MTLRVTSPLFRGVNNPPVALRFHALPYSSPPWTPALILRSRACTNPPLQQQQLCRLLCKHIQEQLRSCAQAPVALLQHSHLPQQREPGGLSREGPGGVGGAVFN